MIRWLTLLLPRLPIERLTPSEGAAADRPLALMRRDGARQIVTVCSTAAARRGVRPGLTVTAARALCAELIVRPHDSLGDRLALRRVALGLFTFTPDVAPTGEREILLEIGRTARHFGGEKRLCEKTRDFCRSLGYTVLSAVAPTPLASRVLARAAAETPTGHRDAPDDDLAAILAPLPWRHLDPDAHAREGLQLFGIKTIGELLSLPPAGLAARLGADFTTRLDGLLDPQRGVPPILKVPPRFRETIDWWPPATTREALLFAARRLFREAQAFLEGRREGVRRAELLLRVTDPNRDDIPLTLHPVRPTERADDLLRLVELRLESRDLPAPVDRIVLAIAATEPLTGRQARLFATAPSPPLLNDAGVELCDRLISRLGRERVLSAAMVAEHRPEYAYRWRAPTRAEKPFPPPPDGRRPLTVTSPRPLAIEEDGAHRPRAIRSGRGRGALTVRFGPERIESGWWDGDDVRRHYYEVELATGARWWIYRDLDSGRWYRHGTFS